MLCGYSIAKPFVVKLLTHTLFLLMLPLSPEACSCGTTVRHFDANLNGNVIGDGWLVPHCLYTYKQAKSVRLIVDTIIHVVGNKFSCCNCTAVSRNTCRCNKAKAFSCEAYREYKFAFSACCASDNSPLLIRRWITNTHVQKICMRCQGLLRQN